MAKIKISPHISETYCFSDYLNNQGIVSVTCSKIIGSIIHNINGKLGGYQVELGYYQSDLLWDVLYPIECQFPDWQCIIHLYDVTDEFQNIK